MDREETTVVVGELALGLLEGDEEREALDLIAVDPFARDEYELWRRHLGALQKERHPIDNDMQVILRRTLDRNATGSSTRGWRQDIARMFSDRSWVVTLLFVKAALIAYLVVLFT